MNTLPANLCDVCTKPGACCKSIHLYSRGYTDKKLGVIGDLNNSEIGFHPYHAVQRAKRFLKAHKLPFKPIKNTQLIHKIGKHRRVTMTFSCPHLSAAGRCGIYQDRPSLCKSFKPASGPICVFYTPDKTSPLEIGQTDKRKLEASHV